MRPIATKYFHMRPTVAVAASVARIGPLACVPDTSNRTSSYMYQEAVTLVPLLTIACKSCSYDR